MKRRESCPIHALYVHNNDDLSIILFDENKMEFNVLWCLRIIKMVVINSSIKSIKNKNTYFQK